MSRSWARLTGLTGRVWSSGEMLQGGSGLWTGWQRERQGVGESHVVNTYPVRCGNKVVFSRSGSSIRRFSPSLQGDRSKVFSVRPSSNINILPRLRVDSIHLICINIPYLSYHVPIRWEVIVLFTALFPVWYFQRVGCELGVIDLI